jgi:hypothetical protein
LGEVALLMRGGKTFPGRFGRDGQGRGWTLTGGFDAGTFVLDVGIWFAGFYAAVICSCGSDGVK